MIGTMLTDDNIVPTCLFFNDSELNKNDILLFLTLSYLPSLNLSFLKLHFFVWKQNM